MRVRVCVCVLAALCAASAAWAATISGVVSDETGAILSGARVALRDVSGREVVQTTGTDGKYRFDQAAEGTYLLIVTRAGFAQGARTVVVTDASQAVDLSVVLRLGTMTAEMNVTATRAERELRQIPLHVEVLSAASLAQTNPLSTGDALARAANVTPVGNGPFGVRPRLRGLDSTRLLVLVDGQRLNTARQATDRTGAEVGLFSTEVLERLEIVNGAGTVLYGSDALAGTINLVSKSPSFSGAPGLHLGGNLYYSGNEDGRRGSVVAGVSAPRYAIRLQAGAERFEPYRSGAFDVEDTSPLFADGTLRRADTIDDAFGFRFGAFPDPFNAPFTRDDRLIGNSQARGSFVNASGVAKVGGRGLLHARYQRTRMRDVGFPDFADPFFFNATSLPYSDLDRASLRYDAQAITPWFARLSVSAHYQRTARLLKNLLPIQFPAPTPQVFFPIAVMRLELDTETEQRVTTPGVDVQAVFQPARRHVLTTGLTFYRDRSRDNRTATTTTFMVGQVAMGARGPAPIVFPEPVQLGAPVVTRPVRVPNAALQDVALFLQDEWRVLPRLSIVAGLRGDFYRVTTDPTPGYDVGSLVAGATPAIDPATLPNPSGTTISRRALTGDVGMVANAGGGVSPFVRVGRSYRHPNLEELLFAGPATIGNLAPNIAVRPEVGTNFDAGAHLRFRRFTGGAYVFLNQYRDFIAQDLVVATTSQGPLAQATNYADVRIGGVELSAEAPLMLRRGILTLSATAAVTRGTITRGLDPLTDDSLAGTPADNITPTKGVVAARFTVPSGRWWVEYGVRAQSHVDRVARTLLESPFLIAQDLLSLDGFAVHRVGAGIQLLRSQGGVRLTFAIENLADRFYREHFQFAPARGRSASIGVQVGGF
jgi:hemoglobin/transferrin/lactoferrin receptor protein